MILASTNPVVIYAVATILGGIVLGLLTWVAVSLLRQGEILAVVTTALPAIQADIRVHGAQISQIQIDQAHLEGALEARGLLQRQTPPGTITP